jgi:molybdopterin-guanine dinucleotide biosynthesis protein A
MLAAGFVLVGGQSSRMGRDKARLKVDSRLLVDLIAEAVLEAAGNVTLVGNPAAVADLPFECLSDLRPGCGPLGGIEAALASARAELNLVVACDMPGIQAADLTCLLDVCERTNAACVLAKDASGRRHPLCAVYRSACLTPVTLALDAGRRRLLDLVEELKAVEVPIASVLTNVNTPEEWIAWKARVGALRAS